MKRMFYGMERRSNYGVACVYAVGAKKLHSQFTKEAFRNLPFCIGVLWTETDGEL